MIKFITIWVIAQILIISVAYGGLKYEVDRGTYCQMEQLRKNRTYDESSYTKISILIPLVHVVEPIIQNSLPKCER